MIGDGVVCLGAGLAGLGFARTLPGAKVFEASNHPGGHVWSHPLEGISFDEGAHICHSKDEEWLSLIFGAAGNVIETPASNVSNWWHGSWLTYPVQNHLHELSLPDRRRALIDFVGARLVSNAEPVNYQDYCLQQYGAFLTNRFYAEYTKKYWRLPMEALGTDWLSGRLVPAAVDRVLAGALGPHAEEQTTFARFSYPAEGGFYSFVEPLFEPLDIVYNAKAVEIDSRRRHVKFADGRSTDYSTLASSIPLPDLVAMISDAPSAVRDASARLRHTQMLCVNMVVNGPDLAPYHWFYIYDENIAAARVSIPSNLSPGSAGIGRSALQAEVFRGQDEEFNVDGLVEDTVADMAHLLRFSPQDVIAVAGVKLRHAYVVSDFERASAVQNITSWLATRSIHTMGLFGQWRYVWSDAAFRSGVTTAKAIADHLTQ